MLDEESRGKNPTFWDKTKAFILRTGLQVAGIFDEARNVSGKNFVESVSIEMNAGAEKLEKETVNLIAKSIG